MRILLLGASGQLGHELTRCLAPLGELTTVARSGHHRALDLSRLDLVEQLLGALDPELIVNAAAYTAVDRAEDEPEACSVLNSELPARLAARAAASGCPLVHYSTDYVFDGSATVPYTEESPTAPLGVYGRSKFEGEQHIRRSGCTHLILRSSWVYSTHGHNFLKTILGLAQAKPELRVVDDQIGTPTWARALAQLSAAALARLPDRAAWQQRGGTYHVSAGGEPTSWFGFADAFVALARERGLDRPLARLRPIRTADYPTRARRPAYSVLDNGRFERAFGLRVPPWRRQLRWCMEDFVPMPGTAGGAGAQRTAAAGGR